MEGNIPHEFTTEMLQKLKERTRVWIVLACAVRIFYLLLVRDTLENSWVLMFLTVSYCAGALSLKCKQLIAATVSYVVLELCGFLLMPLIMSGALAAYTGLGLRQIVLYATYSARDYLLTSDVAFYLGSIVPFFIVLVPLFCKKANQGPVREVL